MIKLLKPFVSFWRLLKKTNNIRLAYRFLPQVYTPALESPILIKDNYVIFHKYKKAFSRNQLRLFGGDGGLLLKFIKSGNMFFAGTDRSSDNKVLVKLNKHDIYFFVKKYDNLKVLEEIFIDRVYDLESNEKYVVCDVGMNIAAASLYFASFENIEKVYSYEPFLATYETGIKNIKQNSELAQKIETKNFGLGKKDEQIEVPLPHEDSLGGATDISFIEKNYKDYVKKVRVEIKNIIPVLKFIMEKHPLLKIILKLDCEGAEYDIIEQIESNKMIDSIAIYMIEFHFRGKNMFRDIFKRNNFIVISPVDEDISPYGMLYAIKPD